jgi:uncharacterized protein involved in oxidation of intracellular sulfur
MLIILNDQPYGTERSYNGLRLALALQKHETGPEVTVFLMADAVACAKSGQTTPDGFYNIERMLKSVLQRGRVLMCGSCLDARGLAEDDVVAGCERSTMDELAQLTIDSNCVLVL